MAFAVSNKGSGFAALVPRTAALLIIFYQIRLLAGDMADTPVFAAALAGALFTAFFLCRAKVKGLAIRPVQALIVIAMVPWAIRLLIALPRWFTPGVSGTTILLDSLLLNLDRNNFSALLPFYWISVTSYFARRSRLFLRADIIAADTFFLVVFSIVPTASMDAYRWPVLMISLFALVLFLQILSLVLSIPPELKLRRKESIPAGVLIFLLIFLGGALFLRPFQERAVEKGGGLLEPKLFRFDFSQFLRLESEISMNDDLVMIVKKDPDDPHILLRRYTLSGYGPGQGFYRLEDVDEAAHPQRLPNGRTLLSVEEIKNFRLTDQEYYIVNFDAAAFIGMNMPVEIIPFESWDASSFNSAYAVKSHTSEAMPFELIQAVRGDPKNLMLSAEEYALYTEYGADEEIASFAGEIISSSVPRFRNRQADRPPSYWEQIQMVYDRLKFGEYRYSLKPGIAPDGDQLKFFLFNSKKGYCSYYAFAFTLMLRSLGIPSRVAAGFFVNPADETFNYYPVRADMAHAWVEVWFPGYGWIEYDPTSEIIAEGEDFRFSQGTPPELFERLMKEILENRSRLRVKEGEAEKGKGNLAALGTKTLKFFTRWGYLLAAAALVFLFLALRSGFLWLSFLCGNGRKKAKYLWAHARRRLALAGFAAAGAEWAKNLDHCFGGLYSLYLDFAAARFAPVYTPEDCRRMEEHYRLFSGEYRKSVPALRRLLAWLLPPLALVLRPKPDRQKFDGKKPDGPPAGGKGITSAGMILLIVLLFSLRGEAQDALSPQEPGEEPGQRADMLYEQALNAQFAENWERAIELFSMGAKTYPHDSRFPWSLGDLYYYRRLYRLAWDEYRRAEKIISREPSLLLQLANTAGFLNWNDVSAGYLEQVLAFEPENREAIGTLAWMYFKLHRLPEGERLLLNAMERYDYEEDFAMTLGTIYSDMFRYDEAKESYLKAIKAAERTGDRLIAALSHYNLSILESRFYRFSLAFDRTNASLEAMNRASGRLASGELFLRRMEISQALSEYQEAYGMDSSPLSKLNLAEVFQNGGRLAEAVLYAEDCLKAGDNSWMLNYGIDPVRYKRDIHEILKDAYNGLFKAEEFSCTDLWYAGSLKEAAQSYFRKISYRFRGAVHTHLFRKYSLLAADAYTAGRPGDRPATFPPGAGPEGTYKQPAGEIHLDALTQYFNAFKGYPRRAMSYLSRAREFEEVLIPGSVPSYDFEEGSVLKNRRLLEETLGEFDPVWERDMIVKVYAELAAGGKKAERQEAAEKLFAINRGALLQNGIRLPVSLSISGTNAGTGEVLKKAVKAAGLEKAGSGSPRFTLNLSPGTEGTILCELYDGGKGIFVYRQNLPLSFGENWFETRARRAAFARALRDGIFNAF